MNEHLKHFNKMFAVGATWEHEDRISGASTSTNVPPPAKYGLRKDHKDIQPNGHPVRPVCGANDAPNSRFSHFLSMIVCHYADSIVDHHECKANEEMRAALEESNKLDKSVREKFVLLSMDVKSLYPSMHMIL